MFSKDCFAAVAYFTGTALILKLLGIILPSFLTYYYHCTASILLFLILSWQTFLVTKRFFLSSEIRPERKAVLITGCDSGFGHNLAKRLDKKGFDVFATCLFPSEHGADELKKSCSNRLKILHLDVTKDESVEKATEFVKTNIGTSELWAIVNNAGIHKGISTELTGLEEFKDCLEVNLFGPIRVTKAFLPLLKQSKGRVVNITSILGRVTGPHMSPYVVSKYAAVGFSDSLRQELIDWGIHVISIEPEMFRTGLTDIKDVMKRIEHTFSKLNECENTDYDEEDKRNLLKLEREFLVYSGSNIQVVIDDLEAAVSLKYPNSVYSPRRSFFMRFVLYFYVAAPIPVRDFFVQVTGLLLGYKKPKKASL